LQQLSLVDRVQDNHAACGQEMLMKRSILMLALSSSLLFVALGCAHPYYGPPPPPPPPMAQGPSIVQLAERNGFQTGRTDGAMDADRGAPPHPRHTRAFHDTPGYDPQLGPVPVYRDAFRNAYMRGYQRGYNRN
jgi:hypothetical protein